MENSTRSSRYQLERTNAEYISFALPYAFENERREPDFFP